MDKSKSSMTEKDYQEFFTEYKKILNDKENRTFSRMVDWVKADGKFQERHDKKKEEQGDKFSSDDFYAEKVKTIRGRIDKGFKDKGKSCRLPKLDGEKTQGAAKIELPVDSWESELAELTV